MLLVENTNDGTTWERGFSDTKAFYYLRNTTILAVKLFVSVGLFLNRDDMKTGIMLISFFILVTLFLVACKKKEPGVCYCKYFSGDKTEYDLSSLKRSEQIDSCYRLNELATGFAGDCKLK